MIISLSQLCMTMTRLSLEKAREYTEPLNFALGEWKIDSRQRSAAFLGQVAHESIELRTWEEIWGPTPDQKGYEGSTRLGNMVPGDGYRYRGRGPIQLTGRANYLICGRALGLDLVGNPDQVLLPGIGFRVSGWFWSMKNLNMLADLDSQIAYDVITRRINGGLNGKTQRDAYWRRARRAVGLPELLN